MFCDNFGAKLFQSTAHCIDLLGPPEPQPTKIDHEDEHKHDQLAAETIVPNSPCC
jgi:hypothetical protein